MKSLRVRSRWLLCLLALTCLMNLSAAEAHLMVAQRGTLNIVGSGGYVVMALPVDAFTGVDDDGDGRMSIAEMRAHASHIEAQVFQGLTLFGDSEPRPLQGLMLNLSPDDHAPLESARHLVVLGRFQLDAGAPTAGLTLRFTLFGKDAQARRHSITIIHGAQKQQLVLTPGREQARLFPSASRVIFDNARVGAEHVVSGWDHMLFLLLVLATGWGFRQIALALTCFTLGHGITLAASALWGLSVPSSIVEPTIAATIVGLALFDRYVDHHARARSRPWSPALRLGVIFICALIHGLGFAGAMTALGVDAEHRLLSLLGFNAGIEAAQLAVALVAAAALLGIKGMTGTGGVAPTTRFASNVAMVVGCVWLVERLVVIV